MVAVFETGCGLEFKALFTGDRVAAIGDAAVKVLVRFAQALSCTDWRGHYAAGKTTVQGEFRLLVTSRWSSAAVNA